MKSSINDIVDDVELVKFIVQMDNKWDRKYKKSRYWKNHKAVSRRFHLHKAS